MKDSKQRAPNFVKKAPKKTMSIRMDEELIQKAKGLRINISKVCRKAIRQAINGEFAS